MSTQPNISAQLRQFIAEELLFTPGGLPFSDHDSLLESGAVDSLGVMRLVTHVRELYGIDVAPRDVTPDNFDSVASLARYIAEHRNGAPSDSPR